MRMDGQLTRTSRLSAMLIVAAVAVPAVALVGMLLLRRYVLVHYDTHTLMLWLVLDAVLLAVGLILRESETLSKPAKRRSTRSTFRKR
jgi:uncharacterized membrane protein